MRNQDACNRQGNRRSRQKGVGVEESCTRDWTDRRRPKEVMDLGVGLEEV